MCDTCGCGTDEVRIYKPGNEPHHHHHHLNPVPEKTGKIVRLEQDLLSTNDALARENRNYFNLNKILALNLVSSPGSGKTTILEKTLTRKNISTAAFYVIEGDQQTDADAARIEATGVPVVQVNTGTGCHLDAQMIKNAVRDLTVEPDSLLLIENVGNLVCPALFDLGEHHKVVIISTAEGEDKPLKYPHMFRASSLCLINKTDLLPYVDFDPEKCREYARSVNPDIQFIEISAKTEEGFSLWEQWIAEQKLS